jgi:hypothetical protein
MNHWLLWVLLFASLFGAWNWYAHERSVKHETGVAVASERPVIELGSSDAPWTDRHGFRYKSLGRFYGRVVVVARRNYNIGEFATLAPTDLAIVWGPLSDPALYGQLNFDQRGSPFAGRFVFPELRRGTEIASRPFPEIEAFLLANLTHVHTIPATADIRSTLAGIRPGQVIRFSGRLVEATSPSGGIYVSSRTLGDYNCEIAWIDELELIRV